MKFTAKFMELPISGKSEVIEIKDLEAESQEEAEKLMRREEGKAFKLLYVRKA